jgi:tetratricopeptide (TPR) repeat protein
MQVASEESVLGDFNDSSFVNFGVTTRFFTEDGRFLVNTEGADGSMADFEVAYTFGVDPLQQYLIEFPGGRLQTLGVAWDTEQDRWFHLYPDERITSDDPLHWTRDLQNWNFMCAECHSTNLQKNFDLATDSYDTEWDAINVGCQSCHGPGEGHISWANNPGLTSEAADARGLVVNFADAVPRFQVESCAACHSRRRQVSTDDRVGEPFMDHFMPETLRREDLYHADGQILGEVYVYGSFLQSRMYQEGVQCTDCHNPHSLDLRVRGNAVCEQCHHPEAPMNRFPTLQTKNYNTPDHHFHAADSEGAQCVNCHMVDRTYMVVDPRRDHSFRIPRPDLSVAVGTPNACNDCHTDQTAAWAAEAVIEWYGAQRQRDPHYGEILAAGRRGDPDAGAQLGALAADQEEPAIVRATALELLAAYGTVGRQAFGQGLRDREPLVRASAITGFEQLEVDERSEMLPPLLLDPVRGVRLEAARVLAPATGSLQGSDATVLAAMLAEYEQVQVSLADTAAAHQNLGVIHSATGNTTRAVADYAMALRLDSGFLPASINLSNLLNQMGRNPDATEVLANAIERNPEEGELHYSLGLVQAEMNQLADAAQSLGRAADLLPARGRVRYNYGLALQRLGRREEAETQLLESQLTAPGDPSVVEALAIFYSQDERWGEALEWAQAWVEMQPASPEARRFLEAIPQQ